MHSCNEFLAAPSVSLASAQAKALRESRGTVRSSSPDDVYAPESGSSLYCRQPCQIVPFKTCSRIR